MVKRYRRFRSEVEKGLYKVNITVSDEAPDWFYELRKMMKKKDSYELPRSYIIKALFNSWMKLDINGKGIRPEEGLEGRILEAVKNYQ